ncbi:uncharacterized protein GIQ15_01214 [Arthroderma uncinatum]|uniref:uncharacterized protein n=1 Tax=Arthroderma uncinatum TaxID=74035 RepID=UPI00144A6335|nr:uncharacterized protein GIQ15_01214 [Arthroderma uncinatum]KAF3491697.1 hypothetical protein GIQ15_01214 [Arthroderma uncinatum]
MASSNIAISVPGNPVTPEKEYESKSDSDSCSGDDCSNAGDNTTPTTNEDQLALVADTAIKDLEKRSKEGLQVLEKLDAILKKYPSSTGIDKFWYDQIQDLKGLSKDTSRVVVGVVGSTGAGKSSVINALLGEERLVPTSGMRASTAVVTKISYNPGPWKYSAEVQFVSRASWEREMRLLFEDMHDGLDDISSTDNSELGVACAKFTAVYKRPLQDVKHMSVEELMKNETVASMLGSTKYISGDDTRQFYNQMRKYVDSEESPRASFKSEPETLGLKSGSKQGIAEEKSMELWPLVELVRLQVNAPVLSTGVVVVDLPGLLDVNAARGTLAQKYIQSCSSLWVVAPITRAVDDHSARTLLGDGFKRQLQLDGALSQVTFICSKADDIDLSEATDDLEVGEEKDALNKFCEDTKGIIKHLRKKIQSLKRKEERASLKMDKLTDEIEKLGDSTTIPLKRNQSNDTPSDQGQAPECTLRNADDCDADDSENAVSDQIKGKKGKLITSHKQSREKRITILAESRSLKDEVQSHLAQIKQKENEFALQCITKRNEFSKSRIQEDFLIGLRQLDSSERSEGNNGPTSGSHVLPVFCVSSRAYQSLKRGFLGDSVPKGFLTVEDTEIPQLQRHCLNLGVAAQKINYERFLNNLAQLVNSLRLQSSGLNTQQLEERKECDRELLHVKLNTLHEASMSTNAILISTANSNVKFFHKTVQDLFAKHSESRQRLYIKLDHASTAAMVAADEAPVKWNKDPKLGGIYHSTYKAICRRSGAYRNGKKAHDWNTELAFINEIPVLLETVSNTFRALIEEFNVSVMMDVKMLSENETLSQILKDQSLKYQENVNQTLQFLSTKIELKQRDLNRSFVPAIAQALENAYAEVYEYKGAGAFQRMRDTIAFHVGAAKYDMFQHSVEAVKLELEKLAEVLKEVLSRKVEKIFTGIAHDYMTGLKNSKSEMEKPLKEEILSFLNSTLLFGEFADTKKALSDDCVSVNATHALRPIVLPGTDGNKIKLEPEE